MLFTFFSFIHTLLVALFFISFLYILMKQIQTTKIHRKSIPAYGFKKSQAKNLQPKVWVLLASVCDFQKENHTLGYGFKNLSKIYSLAYGFLFFVISIPGLQELAIRESMLQGSMFSQTVTPPADKK